MVLYDSVAPLVSSGANAIAKSGAMTDIWVYTSCPVEVTGTRDDVRLQVLAHRQSSHDASVFWHIGQAKVASPLGSDLNCAYTDKHHRKH